MPMATDSEDDNTVPADGDTRQPPADTVHNDAKDHASGSPALVPYSGVARRKAVSEAVVSTPTVLRSKT
jgi:hypothetical protein